MTKLKKENQFQKRNQGKKKKTIKRIRVKSA